jgi:hypothetical protein
VGGQGGEAEKAWIFPLQRFPPHPALESLASAIEELDMAFDGSIWQSSTGLQCPSGTAFDKECF